MPSIEIRPATREDLPTLVAMRNDLNDLERAGCPHAAIQPMTLEEFTTVWGPTLTSPHYCWRIVETEGQPIGFGMIYLTYPQLRALGAFVQWTYLAPEHRRAGAGQRLIDHLFDWARGKEAKRVELQFIDGNGIAEQFWGKMGFIPYARKAVREL